MAFRSNVLLIVLILVVIALFIKLVDISKTNVDIEEADASNFVLEDLQTSYPEADIEIMAITQKYNVNNAKYFEVKAKVTEHPDSPCPERFHIFYNYPAQNFVAQPPEVITSNCEVCKNGLCTIAFPEEAIIASHTFAGTGSVHEYVTTNDVPLPTVEENDDSWIVLWNSESSVSYFVVKIHRNGTLLNVTQLEKV